VRSAPVRIEHGDAWHATVTVVDWCLGNTCNQHCSYCPAALNDGSVAWPELATAIAFCDRVISHHDALGRRVNFHFTGGEPTMYPGLIELLRFVKRRGATTGLLSNGSRSTAWWEQVWPLLDAVVLTYHVEFAKLDHFVEVARRLAVSIKTHINVTMLPARFDECREHAESIAARCEGATMTLKPLLVDFKDQMYPYTAEQKLVLQRGCAPSRPLHADRGVRGSMRCVYDDGASTTRPAADFVIAGDNQWRHWMCNAGIESIAVNTRGEVYRAVCREGGLVGRIQDATLSLPAAAIRCEKRSCSCLSDIMITKWKTA
jgi:organic radical activating enzyme